ncbi:MAG: DUF4260 domain-containing protein [Candidatus Magasanikbacteria bacterium]
MNLDWKFFERTESIAVLALSLFSYFSILNGSGLIFLVLILLPDISMAGYLKDEELGALLYNIFHNYLLPAILLSYGIISNNTLLHEISLIWISHIAGDRILGYGLKKKEGFKHTHLKSL